MPDIGNKDLEETAAALQGIFPDLPNVAPLTLLARGANSVVVESPTGHVFRVGRSQMSFHSYRKEAQLLPLVRNEVEIPVPSPEWLAGPTPAICYGAIGYSKLPGVPLTPKHLVTLDWRRIAGQLGEFAGELHTIPTASVGDVELPEFHSKPAALSVLWDRASQDLESTFMPREYDYVRRWVEAMLTDDQMQDYRPCLIHGDLSCWNTLVDEGSSSVSGIVDFEHACVGDPAQDLLTHIALGREFYDGVVAAYCRTGGQLEPSFEHRVHHLRIMRILFSLAFHAETKNAREYARSIRKLRRSALFESWPPG